MRRAVRRAKAFRRQSKQRQALFLQACLYLTWARLLLRFFSFRQLTPVFNSPLRKTVLSSTEREQLRLDVCWGIERAAEILPGRTVCFPRGIAAQIMCRKRGIDSILYYGAKVDPLTGLSAHVWVQDGTEGVVGHLVANQYHVLARFLA
jgi:hypothetical protein